MVRGGRAITGRCRDSFDDRRTTTPRMPRVQSLLVPSTLDWRARVFVPLHLIISYADGNTAALQGASLARERPLPNFDRGQPQGGTLR